MADTVDLKEYVDKLREADQTAVRTALSSSDKRLDLLNELRGNVLSRQEFDAKQESYEQKLEALQKIVYMGLGALAVIQLLFKFFIK